MKSRAVHKVLVFVLLSAMSLMGGCGRQGGEKAGDSNSLISAADLGPTIGSVAAIGRPRPVEMEGYGLVGALPGTGSADCPAGVRAYLKRYIPSQLGDHQVDVDKLIDSADTAVVSLEAVIPPAAAKDQTFDVKVVAVASGQEVSLEGGWLYTAELIAKGAGAAPIQPFAIAAGPVYVDMLSTAGASKNSGYILGGGRVMQESRVPMTVQRPDYRLAGQIRNRLTERFGPDAARAISASQIEVTIPAEYRGRELRFVDVVGAVYVAETPELNDERVRAFVRRLAVGDERYGSEVALEAIGKASLGRLPALLKSSNEEVRLRAARCMLNLGGDAALATLREITLNAGSVYRMEALEAIVSAAPRNDIAAISRSLLRDPNEKMVVAGYQQLSRLGDIAVTRTTVGRRFVLDEVGQTDRRAIYVARSGPPRIVLFGSPLFCHDSIFVQSPGGDVMMDSRAGQKYVSLTRKHPTRPTVIGPLRSSFDLEDIIHTLAEDPAGAEKEKGGGLGVSYAETAALLEQMCAKHAVEAEFWPGPLPQIGQIVKK